MKKICEEAFAGCSWGIDEGKPGRLIINAEKVTVGKKAFTDCYLLQDIEIKASKSLIIEDEAFESCYNLLKVRLPKKTRYLGEKAFYDCGWDKKLTITIPAGVRHIGSSPVNRADLKLAKANTAYKTQNGLLLTSDGKTVVRVLSRKQKEIVIPDTVTTILPGAFERSKAESLIIPDSVTAIPDDMIRDDVHLQKVSWGNGIISIGKYAFYNTCLKKVILPDSVRSIDRAAFANGKKLKTVRLNNGLESVGDLAFLRCGKLKGLKIPNTVSFIGQYITGINYDLSGFFIEFEDGNPYYEQVGNDPKSAVACGSEFDLK